MVAAQDVVAAQLALLRDYQAPGLGRWRESPMSTFLFQIHPFVTVAALASIFLAWIRRDARYLILARRGWSWGLFGAGRIRYLVPLFPLLALMAAYGLELMRHARLERLIVWCAVTTSVAIAAFGYLPFLRQTSAANLENAGAYLDRLADQTEEVFTLPQTGATINPAVSVPLLDFYTRKRLVYREAGTAPPPGSRPRRCGLPGRRRRRVLRRARGRGAGSGRGRHRKHARPGPAARRWRRGSTARPCSRPSIVWTACTGIRPWSRSTAARNTTSSGVESWRTSNARIWSGCS